MANGTPHTAEAVTTTALHGPAWRRRSAVGAPQSREPDILQPSEFEHAVLRADGDGHFCRAAPVGTRVQSTADDALEARDIRLDQGAPVIAVNGGGILEWLAE